MAQGHRVAIMGVGYSTVGRQTGLTPQQLAIQAAKAAMDDAGMRPNDIDGISMHGYSEAPDIEPLDAMDTAFMLGMTPLNWQATVHPGAPAFVAAASNAIAAVRAGYAHTCIAFRVMKRRPSTLVMRASGPGGSMRFPTVRVPGDGQFSAPYGGDSPGMGAQMRRHMALYGTTEEQFGANVVTQRYHASLNPEALLRDPLTVDDYLNSRYMAKPARLLDCDYPIDAGSAVIFTTEERSHDWRKKPVFVEAASYSAIRYMHQFDLVEDINQSAPFHCAETLWSRTSLRPQDVDIAELYDGFTIITFQWLEALGFCKPGEAGPFIAAGNTRLGGTIPLNTDGGACNMGRRHGANFCIEATRQLRGECGVRQVPDAKVAVWTNAVGPFSGAVLLTGE